MQLDESIINLVGSDSYRKGLKYFKDFIEYVDSYTLKNKVIVHKFRVESESNYNEYDVSFVCKNHNIDTYSCNCIQFEKKFTCKHVAACLINYKEKILNINKDQFAISNDILKYFIDNNIDNDIKECVKLELELDLQYPYTFKFKIGVNRLYLINSEFKLNALIEAIKYKSSFKLGVNFTYDYNKHYFKDEDMELLRFFDGYKKNDSYYYYYSKPNIFELNDRELDLLFDKINNRKFYLKGYGKINSIKKGFPTAFNLSFKDDNYFLKLNDIKEFYSIKNNYHYVVYQDILYILSEDEQKIIELFVNNGVDSISFKKENKDNFKKGILKKFKNNINIDKTVDDIIITKEPTVSLYFDFKDDLVICNIEFDYDGNIINYFNKDTKIFRDDECENKVINELSKYNFKVSNNTIYIDELVDIGIFLEEGINYLNENYNVYTTKKFDNTNIVKNSSISSNFSIGRDGIMSYSFDSSDIDLSELPNILNDLKRNKKYYRLRDGNILNLDNNEGLDEFNNIIDNLGINDKDISSGNITIPKYEAFYIDSLKNDKYHSINLDNSFIKFINNFKKYKNTRIKFDEVDDQILRKYQKDGVKWLYTLYKCGLGGILADEMGLGKSLQTIIFIKEILKHKRNAKVLIVCPTSLVYNWSKEFEKFASDLKYVTVADNKKSRLEIIKNVDKYNIFITSYGLIRNDNDEYENIEFEVCIIDEAQTIKNYQSQMTREIKKIKARTKIALTGTPIENSVLELWSIFDFIMPGYLKGIKSFKDKYGIKDIDEASMNKLKYLNYQIKPFILRRKKGEVTKDLPEKLENNIYLELSDIQKKLYLKVLKESEAEINNLISLEGFNKSRFKVLQLLTRLRQICVNPSILYSNYRGDNVKLDKTLEIVKDSIKDNHKILIFSSFKTVIDKLSKVFNKEKITNYVISGEVSSKKRMELVDKFNSDDTNCFLITLKSGGTGLNLTSADIVIHLDIWWNPQVENQATDRAHRIGQNKTVSVIKLITKGTIEEKIIELQEKKKVLSDNLIEGKNDSSTLANLTEQDIRNLINYSSN